jgi:CheY-like chemotaxis protein
MRKILIIDDDSKIRQTTQLLLEVMTGWETLVAASGQEGLALAQSKQPDAILLDVLMPDMNGVTTLQKLQANATTQSIPVILFTSMNQEVVQQKFAQLPITGIIPKPFEAHELVEKMRSFLNWDE